jgi:polygalacturonase
MINSKLNLLSLSVAFALCCSVAFAQEKVSHDMAYYINNAPFKMGTIAEPKFADRTFNIKDYGAVSDGQTLNTQAIAKAIAACSAAGGGTVLIPAGLWLTGPIELKSNINLHADRGALILFSPDHSLYSIQNGRGKPQLYGEKLENVGITGEGIYDGAGDTWRPLKKTKAAPTLWNDLVKSGGVVSKDGSMWWPTKQGMEGEDYLKTLKGKKNLTDADYAPAQDFLRPIMVIVANSKNVLIDGPTFKNSPNFAFNPKGITNLIVRNVIIENEYYAQNGDAIDLSTCKNAIVYHCTVHAGDDGICMKSSGSKDKSVAALENIIVAENIVYHAHGGFVVGSNTDGGMNNIWVTNNNFVNTDVGIRIKSSRGRGGLVHNVFIDHIYMHDILNEAILFSTYYEDAGPEGNKAPVAVDDKTPRFEDFHISNVYCNNAKIAVSIIGLPEMPVSKIDLTDVTISATKAFSALEASDITLKNVNIISPDKTVYTLNNARNISINNAGFSNTASTFISAEGDKTTGITVTGTNVSKLPNAVKLGSGVPKGAVIIK